MISLVEAIQGLQNYQHLLEPPNIRYYYAFALNRRNGKGDREKALSIIKEVSFFFVGIAPGRRLQYHHSLVNLDGCR